MNTRFKRTYKTIQDIYEECNPDEKNSMLEGDLCLRYLRNESGLWDDWNEDSFWKFDGVDYNPDHPDNLSYTAYELWLQVNKLSNKVLKEKT